MRFYRVFFFFLNGCFSILVLVWMIFNSFIALSKYLWPVLG